MKRLIFAISIFISYESVLAQTVEISSSWHYAIPNTWIAVSLDGPEGEDDYDLHDEGSADIRIPSSGRYEVSISGLVGLWFDYPSRHGDVNDRKFAINRIDTNGVARTILIIGAAANVTSQAYISLAPTWVELQGGDRLRLLFRYNTDEAQLPFIVPILRVRKIEGNGTATPLKYKELRKARWPRWKRK